MPASCLEELGQRDKEERGDRNGAAGAQIEGVHLVAQPAGEARVSNGLQAGAVNVPDTSLPNVS